MDWTWHIATKYFFSRKKRNFINIISGITVLGLSIGTASLLIILSVFNGLQDLISQMMNHFNPPLKVTPTLGKFMDLDHLPIKELEALPWVESMAYSIEEFAFFEYDEEHIFGKIKGVSSTYPDVNAIDSVIIEGKFQLKNEEQSMAVCGAGIARNLFVDVLNPFEQLTVYMADNRNALGGQNFRRNFVRPIGVFSIQQDIDNEYVIVPLDFVQYLLGKEGQIGALEIKIAAGQIEKGKSAIKDLLGEKYFVKDQYEQDEEAMKIMNIEKWLAFAITGLMIILIAFNLIGCLWMIVLDKQGDIIILKALGASKNHIKKIFIRLGTFITGLSLLIGIFLALLIYGLQKKFGIIALTEGFVVDEYPVKLEFLDFFVVVVAVLFIGVLAAYPPAFRAGRFDKSIKTT